MNNLDGVDGGAAQQTAPWLQIPSRAISVVEHPCLIKNIDKGIVSLGGPVKLSKVGTHLQSRVTGFGSMRCSIHHHHEHAADTTLRA